MLHRLSRIAVALAAVASCTGTIGDAGSGPGGEPTPPTPPAPAAPGGGGRGAPPDTDTQPPAAKPAATGPCAPISRRIVRLTPTQYIATIKAVVPSVPVALDADLASVLPAAASVFDNDARALVLTQPYVDRLFDLTGTVAQQATRDAGTLAPCLAQRPDDPACVKTTIEGVGAHLFRRPLAPDEVAAYAAFYGKARPSAGAAGALAAMLRLLFLSPNAIFRTELGTDGAARPVALTSYERAQALSYLLYDGPPDQRLWDVAGRGELATSAQVAAEARLLLGSPGTGRGVVRMIAQALDTDSVRQKTKNTKRFPGFTTATLADMAQETTAFAERVLWSEDGRLATLYSADYSLLNANLAKLYGTTAPAGPANMAWARLALPAGQRAGVLTQGSFLASRASDQDSDIIRRGKFVRERVLCQALPPPPPNVNAMFPKLEGGVQQRERLAQHAADPTCATCHRLMDPIGLLFENYDAVGKWRMTEAGKPIDPHGTLVSVGGRDIAVNGAIELGQTLASLPEASACFGQRLASFALGDAQAGSDVCRGGRAVALLDGAAGKILDAFAALVASDDFLLRAE